MTDAACAVETCLTKPTIIKPLPLCARHGIETALTVLPLVLAETLADIRDADEADAEPEPISPSDLERAAIAALRVTNTPIGRRNVERAIRSMGGRCASERGAALARWARDGSDLALFDQA